MNSIRELREYVSTHIVGQDALIERLLIALLCDGHLLVEGAPGLAKTRAIKVLSRGIEGDFQRIQFTPDLLPADLTGTEIYRPNDGSFAFQKGPLFHNLILADEINRAPAKVQSALLEAMEERQITAGSRTYPLSDLYLVMATQNPLEQEGTYPLPEAQLDRFLLYVKIDYPDAEAERQILALNRAEARRLRSAPVQKPQPMTTETLFAARDEVLNVHMSEPVEQYLLSLVLATRNPGPYGDDLASLLQYGASPRATIALDRASRAYAWLNQRDFVSPDDVQAIAKDVLRHRVLLRFEAEAQGLDSDAVIDELIARIGVP
ncbi:MAG: AAA family ATPase [Gammaproteobacteria bacterium]